MKRHNKFKTGNKKYSQEDRIACFWAGVDKRGVDDCWMWKNGRTELNHYGWFWIGTRSISPHRFSFMLHIGRELSQSEHVLHSCPGGDNPGCCNPSHLRIGTNEDNIRDKVIRGRHNGWKKPNTPTGERHHRAKLSDDDVTEIKRRIALGHKITHIAKDFSVTVQNIWCIKNGKSRRIR